MCVCGGGTWDLGAITGVCEGPETWEISLVCVCGGGGWDLGDITGVCVCVRDLGPGRYHWCVCV